MKRKQRYNQKLAELEDRIDFITANLGTKKTFQQNRLHSKGIYKEYQELVETITDLAAMTTKDQNKIVEDDYSNLDKLATTLHLNTEHTIQLKKANGLRNILVHEYNGIINQEAYDSIKETLPHLAKLSQEMRKWLKKKK